MSHTLDIALPLTDPLLRNLLVFFIILVTPILFNKIKIPGLLGFIIIGALIGSNGFHLMDRDSSIVLSGNIGLLYIMFLAGLEVDIIDFKKNSKKSLVFGLYTFFIPMVAIALAAIYILKFSIMASLLLGGMLASHTLLAYPLISKLGVAKNRVVNITVGGTVVADTLSLLVLAIIVGMTTGEANAAYWLRLSVSIIAFTLVIVFLFPIIARWFFKRYEDNILQYIFVMVMVFVGSSLAAFAGVESIIGAFFAGLALNRLIPSTSPLMNRVEFVGNAIFIPYFLIGIGMLIDYRAFLQGIEALEVAAVMIVFSVITKYVAAWLTQKTFSFSANERGLIFGLSNARVAVTLASVLVGYNIILGHTSGGESIRLFNESILNGTVLLILFTSVISSISAQQSAKKIAAAEAVQIMPSREKAQERILIPMSNIENTGELVNLGITLKQPKTKAELFALNVISNSESDELAEKAGRKILHQAATVAASTDNILTELLRYDIHIVNGINSVVKEHKITDLILGLHTKKGLSDSFLGNLIEGILTKCDTTTLIYKPVQPFATIKRHFIVVPDNAHKEIGFTIWLERIWNMSKNSGAQPVFYCSPQTIEFIDQNNLEKNPVEYIFKEFMNWDDFLILSRDLKEDDNLILVLSREGRPSYHKTMSNIPTYLNKYFQGNSFILIYPRQIRVNDISHHDEHHTSAVAIKTLDNIGKSLVNIFKRK